MQAQASHDSMLDTAKFQLEARIDDAELIEEDFLSDEVAAQEYDYQQGARYFCQAF